MGPKVYGRAEVPIIPAQRGITSQVDNELDLSTATVWPS